MCLGSKAYGGQVQLVVGSIWCRKCANKPGAELFNYIFFRRRPQSITRLKPLTGEPCAGEPHLRLGGRGGRVSFPPPINDVRQKATGSPLREDDAFKASNCQIIILTT